MKKISVKQFAKILYELTSDKKVDSNEIISVFSSFLIKNQAVGKVEKIIEEFIKYSKIKSGITPVTAICSRVINSEIVEDAVSKVVGKAEIDTVTDESILGGIKIVTENKIFDATIKTQLNKLKEKMLNKK